ncbi:amidohydrolase family protein [Providencia vermicola]|uniref:amidohydrolase n=1 Tax=Providencia TaxID=586 RepID=UPI0013A7A47F|nr:MULTISPECIES: amidohydrolase family protein [Providencia]ELR5144156.1 amidohydrolase family protein [Providencia stuartii]QIC14608.1 amidohydrolase family protein [Providencia vermicola]WER22714.1 amidohydrolase family protein [Providencia stuartii]WER26834.1 amidohydrolase family protein [Providencia stuartii]WER30924.1 amidohydrolase family protein [Providencia stuartii]
MNQEADLVIINAKVATVDSLFSFAEAIAVSQGRIIDVGSNDDISQKIGVQTQVIDANKKLVLPAANDAHIHATHTGMLISGDFLDLFESKGKNEFDSKLDAHVLMNNNKEWIYGIGCPFELIDDNQDNVIVDSHYLTKKTEGKLATFSDFSLHNLIVNKNVIDLVGLGKELIDLPKEVGRIGVDKKGEPTGIISEWGAMNLVGKYLPQLSDEALKNYILLIQSHLLKNGITSYTDILGPGGDNLFHGAWSSRIIRLYKELYDENKLLTRVSVNLFAAKDGIHSFKHIIAGIEEFELPTNINKSWLKINTIKLFGDSSPCIRKSHNHYHGELTFQGDTVEEQITELKRTIVELHRLGWQVGIHAIGGKTIDAAIEAFAYAEEIMPNRDLRHFIIHGDDLTIDNAKTMAKNNILLSCQPIAGYSIIDNIKQIMPDTYNSNLFNWQAYINEGVVVAAGSDACCFPFNWLKGLEFTLTRKAKNNQIYQPELACHIEDAIRMYTINGAKQEHLEHERGSIEIGKWADLQILSHDIFTIPSHQIGETSVIATICHGKMVYKQ